MTGTPRKKTRARRETPPQLLLGRDFEQPEDPTGELAARHKVSHVIGVDEVGRGPLAGPVITAAVVLKLGDALPDGVADSKALTANTRAALVSPIQAAVRAHALGVASVEDIDGSDILRACLRALRAAVLSAWRQAGKPACVVLVDGRDLLPELELPQHAVISGDARVPAIAAASILAKEHRDELMGALHLLHPQYGFDKHKGYATADHMAALRTHGPSPVHRKTFEPVKSFLLRGSWDPNAPVPQQGDAWW